MKKENSEESGTQARRSVCPACHGTGQLSSFKGVSRFLLSWEECPECLGIGHTLIDDEPERPADKRDKPLSTQRHGKKK